MTQIMNTLTQSLINKWATVLNIMYCTNLRNICRIFHFKIVSICFLFANAPTDNTNVMHTIVIDFVILKAEIYKKKVYLITKKYIDFFLLLFSFLI